MQVSEHPDSQTMTRSMEAQAIKLEEQQDRIFLGQTIFLPPPCLLNVANQIRTASSGTRKLGMNITSS